LYKDILSDGRLFWIKILNYFKELEHNFRIRNADEIFYTNFLKNARKGIVSNEDLLKINGECFRLSIEEAILETNNKSKTIWLASSNAEVNKINNVNKDILIKKSNNLTIDVISKHKSKYETIDLDTSKKLFKITKDLNKNNNNEEKKRFPKPILSLSIGTRVKIIGNIATEIGKFKYYNLYDKIIMIIIIIIIIINY
jgi:hypothetical protein